MIELSSTRLLSASSRVPFSTPSKIDRTASRNHPLGGAAYQVAAVLGLIAMLALWWQMILGMRQVTDLLRLDRQQAVRLHTWLGIFGALAVMLHPVIWRVAENQSWEYLWQLEFDFVEASYISLGRLALLLFLLIWISSTIARYALHYRLWRTLHYLTYPLTLLVFVHSFAATGLLDEHPTLNAYWWLLAITLTSAVGHRLLTSLRAPMSTLAVHATVDGVTTVRLDGPIAQRRARPGQFVALRLRRFGRSHPYSVVQQDTNGSLWLAVDGVGRHSLAIGQLADGSPVFADGPHGAFLDGGGRPGVFIAGGIGITPFLWSAATEPGEDIIIYHLVRTRDGLHFSDVLQSRLGGRYRPVVSSRDGRLRAVDIPQELLQQASFWLCGSAAFTEAWRTQLRRAGVPKRRIRSEQFI